MHLYASLWAMYDEQDAKFDASFIENLDVTGNVKFSTQLHGGYASCQFTIQGQRDKNISRYRGFLNAHLVIFDDYGRRCYVGFVTDTSLNDEGLSVSAFGYYAKGANIFQGMYYQALEATDNLLQNTSFGSLDYWTFAPVTGGNVEVSYADHWGAGNKSAYFTQPNDTTKKDAVLELKQRINVTGKLPYAFSVYLKNNDLDGQPYLKVVQETGTVKEEKCYFTNEWAPYDMVVTMDAGTTYADFIIGVAEKEKDKPNGHFWLDAAQVEQKGYSTPYTVGHRNDDYPITYKVIRDCIDLVPEWIKNYGSVGRAMFIHNEALDFNDKKVQEAIEYVLAYGFSDDDPSPAYFAIWDRTPVLFPEPDPGGDFVDWMISVNNIRGGKAGMSLSLTDVYNRVYAIYDDQGEGASWTDPTLTAPDTIGQNYPSGENLFSQQRYGLKEGLVQNGDSAMKEKAAYGLAAEQLKRYMYPRPVYSIEISGLVCKYGGALDYPYRIRAGDQILITDMDYITALAGSLDGQAAHGLFGFVMSTDYDSSNNTVRLSIGSVDVSYETLLTRGGIGGGMS